MLSQEEFKIRIRFTHKYSQGLWRRFYRYVVKKGLDQHEVVSLMADCMSEDAVKYWFGELTK